MPNSSNKSIVFFATAAFAIPSLQKLLTDGHHIQAVVTAPDKPAGRNLQITPSPIKQFAIQQGLQVLQPEKLKSPAFLETLHQLNPALQIVVAFRMLPEAVWNKPPLGTINLHASLLPQYRGAAPINWAIINGETETGLTTFRLQHAIDTGQIILQKNISIQPTQTAGQLHDLMATAGAALLTETLHHIFNQTAQLQPQPNIDPAQLKPAPKLTTAHCQINFNQTAQAIQNQVRGLAPSPGAFMILQNKILKVLECTTIAPNAHPIKAGEIQTDHKTYLHMGCANGLVSLQIVQLQGKKILPIQDFLRGFRQA